MSWTRTDTDTGVIFALLYEPSIIPTHTDALSLCLSLMSQNRHCVFGAAARVVEPSVWLCSSQVTHTRPTPMAMPTP